MNSTEIHKRLVQILDEERASPTVSYTAKADDSLTSTILTLSFVTERKTSAREVKEDNLPFRFRSLNYDLLSALSSQVRANDQTLIVSLLVQQLIQGQFREASRPSYPNWNGYISESALIAEFVLRKCDRQFFFNVLAELNPSQAAIPMLAQLQDLMAYNWRLLSDSEIEQLSSSIIFFRETTRRRQMEYPAPISRNVGMTLVALADTLVEQCRKASYFYLKGHLQEGLNLEVNQDKASVESFLKQVGFSNTLVESLNEAEKLYLSSSAFDLKSSMSHLRSFLENLHQEAAARLARKHKKAVPAGWGKATAYLNTEGLLTKPQENLVTSLYTFLSDEAVHRLIAEREFARLSRNMVVEYGLLVLTQMRKVGIR